MERESRHGKRAGFTLIEVLAVILILGILAGILITQLGGTEDTFKEEMTRATLKKIEAAIASFESSVGDYPPSSFLSHQGSPPNSTNIGAETLVIALWSKRREGYGLSDEELVNTDGDASPRDLTDFNVPTLLELGDAWGNPIAYLHRSDYGRTDLYLTEDPRTGTPLESAVTAIKNAKTGRYHGTHGYQLISAGLDGEFGTDDDIGNFGRP